MKPRLTLDVGAGDDLEATCLEAQTIADRLDRSVSFHFNSVRCVAVPGGTAQGLADIQQEAQRSQIVVYSNSAKVEIEEVDDR